MRVDYPTYARILAWADARGLVQGDSHIIVVGHNDPMVTQEDKLRISVCLPVPEDTPEHGDIGRMSITAGLYAVARFEIPTAAIPAAWQSIKAGWRPTSGYEPDVRPCFERLILSPKRHPEGLHILEICFAVRPL